MKAWVSASSPFHQSRFAPKKLIAQPPSGMTIWLSSTSHQCALLALEGLVMPQSATPLCSAGSASSQGMVTVVEPSSSM